MNLIEAALRRAIADFRRLRARWALVGGLAVSARAGGRATADIDVAVAVASDAEAEAVVRHFVDAGYTIAMHFEQQPSGRLTTVRLRVPLRDPREVLLDLLFFTSRIEDETVSAAETIQVIAGLTLPTARLPHLLAMKILSQREARPADIVDIQSLLGAATDAEVDETSRLVVLMAERGAAGERDLAAEFEGFCEQFRRSPGGIQPAR